VLCGCHGAPPPRAAPTLAAAVHAFEQYDLAASRRIAAEIAAHATAAADRVAAYRALARNAWRFDRDADAALRALDQAIAIAAMRGDLWRERAQVQLEAGRLEPAATDAARAIAASGGAGARIEAMLVAARVTLARANAAVDRGETPEVTPLRRAQALVSDVLDHQPGRSDASETALGVAVLLADGPALLRAWKSYFFIADEAAINPVLRDAYTTLRALAATWQDRPLSPGERADLATALARSRFHDVAARVAAPIAAQSPALREVIAYQRFVAGIQAVDADFYPRIANGLKHYEEAYDAAIAAPERALWSALETKPFDEDAFFDLVRDRFGSEGYIGNTVGYHGLLLGHIIHDEPREVEQYGRRAAFRLVIIDRMISRDFTSWYGTTNVGGWGTPETMFQVRAAYLEEPFKRLGWVSDPEQRAKLLAEIASAEQDDAARCARDRYADPASVALRIKLHESDTIYAALRGRGSSGQNLALAFVSESMRLNVEATVFAHEGRHSLDQKYFAAQFARMSDDERELRAKFSEVVFSSNPKLALTGSILGARLDETQGHGLANRRFRTIIVDWMASHAREVAGLEPAQPLVLQMDRLTNAQLVAILRAADPMSR
jgi:hypothetical protein